MFLSKKEPKGTPTEAADQVAQEMLQAVHASAWDSIHYVSWNFPKDRHYVWDKKANKVYVTWTDYEVWLDLNNKEGVAQNKGAELSGDDKKDALEKAWKYFCNDSFWLNAPVKAFDPGTKRSLVTMDDGVKGLKVTYTSGGVTPGDSYVWILNDNHVPTACRMWVKIIPIGGAEFSWDDWQNYDGALISTLHKSKAMQLALSGIKAGDSLPGIGYKADLFDKIQGV